MSRAALLRLLALVAVIAVAPSLRAWIRGPGVTITRRIYADSVRVDSTIGVAARGGGLPDSATAAARADSARAVLGDPSSRETWIATVVEASDSVLRRWPVAPMRLVRLWLQDGAAVAGWDAAFPQAVQRGFDGWVDNDFPVRFLFVADSAAADVPVVWVESFPDNRLGVTRLDAWNDTIVRGRITIATQRSDGSALQDTDIRRTALHEAGHLLGLPHSDDPGSVMAPYARVDAPSARDLATVRLLYRLPFGSVRDGGRRPPDEQGATPAPLTTPP